MKKRILHAALAGVMALTLMTACANGSTGGEGANQSAEGAGEQGAGEQASPEAAQEQTSEAAKAAGDEADKAEAAPEQTGAEEGSEEESGSPMILVDSWYDSMNNETEGTGDDYKDYANISIERLLFIEDSEDGDGSLMVAGRNEGSENKALVKALDDDFEARKKATSWFRDSVHESLSYEGADYDSLGYPWPYNDRLTVYRADDSLVSYISRAESYTGGAHGGTSLTGCNIDAASGKRLALRDVIGDFDAFYDKVLEKLEVNEDYYWDEWKDTVKRDVYDADFENGAFAWAVGNDFVELVFGDYELGAYATGHVKVKITESDLPGLLAKEYKNTSDNFVLPITEYENYRLDLNGDGKEDFLRLETEDEYDEGYNYIYSQKVKLFTGRATELNGQGNEGHESEEIEDNALSTAYLMRSSGGKYFVFVEMLSDNDYREIQVFDVNDPDSAAKHLGYVESGAFHSFLPMDPEHLVMISRTDAFGTRSGYRICHLTDKGEIVPYDPEYRIITYDFLYEEDDEEDRDWLYVKAKEDVQAYSDRDKTQEITIPEGSKMRPLRTDDETYMVFSMEDGSEVCIFYDGDREEDGWERLINKKPESELLDGIMYAG